jgi:hypothetical protein
VIIFLAFFPNGVFGIFTRQLMYATSEGGTSGLALLWLARFHVCGSYLLPLASFPLQQQYWFLRELQLPEVDIRGIY